MAEPRRQLRRWCSWAPSLSIASRCAAEPYPLLEAQQYSGAAASSSTIRASRATLARMLAAATLAQSRSAETRSSTIGAGRSAVARAPERTSTSPSSRIASISSARLSSARRAARVSAGMMPTSSISAGLAQPTDAPAALARIGSTRASRRRAVSFLESLTPSGSSGGRPSMISTAQAPTATGPARAPRPTSSMPTTMRRPGPRRAASASSSSRVGAGVLTARPRPRRSRDRRSASPSCWRARR